MTVPREKPRHAVVVSLYEARSFEPLARLFESMACYDAGLSYQLVLVVNRTSSTPLDLPFYPEMQVLERDNTGMNIGAWDHGWRESVDFDAFLFLQDECLIQRDNWLLAFDKAASQGAALIGESLSPGWDRPWPALRATHGKTLLREHQIDNAPANRVDVYLDVMKKAGIDPGPGGRHLRSLVWFARREWLTRIDGFPIGADFGQCIGAEIAVSKAIEAAGGVVAQVADKPFSFIRHTEWHQHTENGPFIHGPAPDRVRQEPWTVRFRRVLRRLLNPAWQRLRSLRKP
ncbi:MAG: hypothetical protein ACRBC3_00690 [Burkholderiaceae bacterium]